LGQHGGTALAIAQEEACAEAAATPDATPMAGRSAPLAAAFPAEGGELTIFAATSLRAAFTAIGDDLQAAHPELDLTFNFAGSPTLVTQLDQGASADLVAFANTEQMAAAIAAGVISGEPEIFVRNELTIVLSSDADPEILTPADLAQEDVTLVLAQPDVPAGRYAREALCAMDRDSPTYGDDYFARVTENIVSEEEDVRAVLTKVQLGEADAGIVYVSDVAGEEGDEIGVIPIPDAVNVVATYPIGLVEGGDEALGTAFIAYILSAEGQVTLVEYGFSPVSAGLATPAAG